MKEPCHGFTKKTTAHDGGVILFFIIFAPSVQHDVGWYCLLLHILSSIGIPMRAFSSTHKCIYDNVYPHH